MVSSKILVVFILIMCYISHISSDSGEKESNGGEIKKDKKESDEKTNKKNDGSNENDSKNKFKEETDKKSNQSKEKDSKENSSNESSNDNVEKDDKNDSKSTTQKWMFNPETGMMIVHAPSAAAVAVLDSKNQLSGLYNGKTGTAILYNNLNGEAFYIAAGLSEETWYESKNKFEDFFPKMESQEKIWQTAETEGLMFNSVSIDEEISKELSQILVGLSKDFSNPSSAFAIFLQLSTTLTTSLNNGLKGFSAAIGKVDVNYKGDLLWLNGVFRGMGDFFALVKGGLETFKKKKVEIDWSTILQMRAGSRIWDYFMEKLSKKIDINELAKTFNNLYTFFNNINKLGGDLEYGSSGFFNIISKIVGQLDGHASIPTIKKFLKSYFESDRTNIDDVKKQFKSDIQYLLKNIKKMKQSSKFEDLMKALDAMLNSKWIYKDINISEIITILTDGSSKKDANKAIENIVKILNKNKD